MAKDGRFFRLIFIVVLLAEAASAQVWTEYLGGVSVNTVLWDSKRRLVWFATSGDGVISFDGTIFRDYNTRTTNRQLPTDTINCATIDKKFELWFGTTRQGLIRFNPDSSQWTTYASGKHGLLSNPANKSFSANILALTVDDDGSIWIGTNNGGINRFDRRSRWDTLTVEDSLSSNDILSIATDNDGNKWFGTSSQGVSRLNCPQNCFRERSSGPGRRLEPSVTWRYYLNDEENKKSINAILIEKREGQLHKWFAAIDGAYHLLPSDTFDDRPRMKQIPGVIGYNGIAVDDDGNLWFGTEAGGARLDLSGAEPVWRRFADAATLSTRLIRSICVDEDGNLWFGGARRGQGAVKFNPNWVSFVTSDGLASNTVGEVAEDASGTIWAGTLTGLSKKISSTQWSSFFSGKNIPTMAFDTENGLWLGTDNDGAIYVPPAALPGDAATNKFYKVSNSGLASNTVNDIALFQREVWFATENGLSRFKPDSMKWETFGTSQAKGGLTDNRVQTVAIDKNGIVWCGTVAGVSRFDPKNKTSTNFIPTQNGQLADWITDILLVNDQADTIWFATNGGGVSPYFNGRWQKPITLADGLADNNVNALAQSFKPAGVWFGTRNGATFREPGGVLTTLRTQHGLSGNVVEALLRDRKNHIWFGTQLRGVTRYTRKENKPRVELLNTFDVTTSSDIVYKFEGADIGTQTPLLRYAYRLSSEKGFSLWTPAPFTKLTLPRNGIYTFYVKTIDTDGNESAEATDTFHKIAPDTGSYSFFKYKIGAHGADSIKLTFFWPPYLFQRDRNPEISVTPFASADQSTLFAFDLISVDSSLNFSQKPVTLTFAFFPSDSVAGKSLSIYQERPQKVKLGGTTKIDGEISTVIQEFGRYAVRLDDQSGAAVPLQQLVRISAQPRIFSPSGRGHGPQTTVSFKLDKPEHVRIQVYNLAGRLVETIWNEPMSAGVNAVAWNGKDKTGAICPTGLYIIIIQSQGFASPPKPVKVMVLNE